MPCCVLLPFPVHTDRLSPPNARCEAILLHPPRPYHDFWSWCARCTANLFADWVTLNILINEDYDDLIKAAKKPEVVSAARWMFKRYDNARRQAGLKTFLSDLPARIMWALEDRMEEMARSFFEEKYRNIPASMEGKTVFIEFARGGPHGSSFPLSYPLGYASTYATLSDAILKDAAVLYIWVTPEMSRGPSPIGVGHGEWT